ncbi:helix-turn-helix transcriptional regulator [Methylobacterium sp. 88A]|uniref:helix-turn-helix transcriptional regulator n=1 Tax=Methylobacterium sp. 88A TaxID=1131813 RepID=UPI0009DA739D|nr:helix-turn-helix transcriptional regulator [Methylobacterium sp. 88A]
MLLDDPLLRILGRIGCGAISVDGAGHIIEWNMLSQIIIGEFIGTVISTEIELRDGLKELMNNSNHRFRIESESWVVIPRKGKKSIALYSIPTGKYKDEYVNAVIVILDMERTKGPKLEVLQKTFNLTLTEAKISLLIIEGKTPNEIASLRNISLWTIRTQLASIYNKTKTRRQAELVSLLLKVSILP